MSTRPENNSLPQPPDTTALHAPQEKKTPPLPSGGRILLHYFLALLFLALLMASRLAGSLEELTGDFPQAKGAALMLRDLGDHSGLNALGDGTSALFSRLSPEIHLGAVNNTNNGPADSPHGTADKDPEQRGGQQLPGFDSPDAADAESAMVAMSAGHRNGTAAQLRQTNATAGMGPNAEREANATDQANQTTQLPTGNATVSGASGYSASGSANASLPVAVVAIPGSASSSTAAQNGTSQTIPVTNATAASTAGNATATDGALFESDKPLVLLVGDSMMMEGLGPALLRNLRTRDDIAVIREAKYSTGLSRKDYFDWPAHMESLVEKYSPAVVIITMGGNDAQDIVDDNKKRHFVATESWGEQYKERASLLIQAAQKEGATVIWVGLPIMGNPTHAKRSLQLCVQQEAACTDNSPCVYVDTLQLLTDSKGDFTAFNKDSDGKQVRIRYKDKIHVTTAGGEILTGAVLPELDALLESVSAGTGDKQGETEGSAAGTAGGNG